MTQTGKEQANNVTHLPSIMYPELQQPFLKTCLLRLKQFQSVRESDHSKFFFFFPDFISDVSNLW